MTRKQTRRTVSITGETYERLKAYCDRQNISMSGFVENIIKTRLSMEQPHQGDPS